MPRLTKSVPSYRHHRASNHAVVTLDGRDYYLGPWQSKASLAEYDRLIGEWLANGRRMPTDLAQSRTVEELLAAFWQHAGCYYMGADGQPTKELDSYRQAMKPVRIHYAGTFVGDFGPTALKHIRQAMIDSDYARSHINHQINRIRRIFKWGVENELVPVTIYQGLAAVAGLKRHRSAARETEPIRPVPDTYVDAVQPYVSAQVWAMIELQRLTGMRSGEVTTMRGCDTTMTGSVWEYRPERHKTAYRGRERVVYLGPKAQEIAKRFLKTELGAYLFSPAEAEQARNEKRRAARKSPRTLGQSQRRTRKVTKRPRGKRYTPDSYRQAIKYGIGKAKVPEWHPHQLRHNAATRIRREHGLVVRQAQKLGWLWLPAAVNR